MTAPRRPYRPARRRRAAAPAAGKPPYRVPSMAEIAALPWNGFTVVSTFAGGGGSSTGYRMAGFRVGLASEFIPAAIATYRANADPATVIDERDIRAVDPADILAALGIGVGELDLLDGSPPCDPFSTAGKRAEHWGTVKDYIDGTRQRTDDLFYEYVRMVDGLKPRVFVAENVSGLVKGVAKGYFLNVLAALEGCGYRVRARLLDASWLGVPQARQRVIFVGVRDDLPADPAFPDPLPYQYTVRDALPWIARVGTAPSHAAWDRAGRSVEATMADAAASPSPAISANGGGHDKGRGMVEAAAGDIVAYGRARVAGTEIDKLRVLPSGDPSPAILAGGMDHVAISQVGIIAPAAGIITKDGPQSADQPAPTILSHGRPRTNNQLGVTMPAVIHDSEGQWSQGEVTDRPAPTVGGGRSRSRALRVAGDSGPAADPETGRDLRLPAPALIHDTGGQWSQGEVTDRPAPVIMTGPHAINSRHFQVTGAGDGVDRDPETGRDITLEPRVLHRADGHPRYSRGDITDQPAATVMASGPGDFAVIGDDGPAADPETGAQLRTVKVARPELRLGAHGDYKGRVVDLDAEPAPTIAATGFGSFAHGLTGAGGPAADPETGKDLTMAGVAVGREAGRVTRGDAVECRRLTLGELRRLGGFPDDYVLCGTYEQRWERIGQSVPPVMMAAVAAAIRDRILVPLREAGAI